MADLVERFAAVLEDGDAAGAGQAEVGLAVAVDVEAADRLGVGSTRVRAE